MPETAPHPFHKRIFFFSLLLIAIQGAWMMVMSFVGAPASFEVAPRIELKSGQGLELKTPLREVFEEGVNGQSLFTGSEIKTGEGSGAAIVLNRNILRMGGLSRLRLVSNQVKDEKGPFLTFQLLEGRVWVNAFNPIEIRTPRASVIFSHAAGDYRYDREASQITMAQGAADVGLWNESGDAITRLEVPLGSEARFADAQVIEKYSQLQYSKLKKELRIRALHPGNDVEPWIAQNQEEDRSWQARFAHEELRGKKEGGVETVWNQVKTKLAFSPVKKQNEELAKAALKKNRIDTFYALETASFEDAGLRSLRDTLRQELVNKASDILAPTYLTDLNEWLRRDKPAEGLKVLREWVDIWKKEANGKNAEELERQSRLLSSVLLSSIDRVTTAILDAADEIEEVRIERAEGDVETLLALARERIETSLYLVNAYRYREAKRYLRKSYTTLKLDAKEAVTAAKELFAEESKLILQRVGYAESVLKGAAEPIDEADFQAYLKVQEKNQELTRELEAFFVTPEEDNPGQNAFGDALYILSSIGLQVAAGDVTVSPETDAVFVFKNARYLGPSGVEKVEGKYDLKNDAFFDLRIGEDKVRGGYLRKDFSRILGKGKNTNEPASVDSGALSPFIETPGSEEDEKKRVDIANRDLALFYVIQDLNKNNIFVKDQGQLEALDADLTQFRVKEALLADVHPRTGKKVVVDFDYDLTQKIVSGIRITSSDVTLFESYPVAQAEQAIIRQLSPTDQ